MNFLDPNTFHRLVSKKLCFLLLNVGAILVLLYYHQVHFDLRCTLILTPS